MADRTGPPKCVPAHYDNPPHESRGSPLQVDVAELQNLHDSLCRTAVPQRWSPTDLSMTVQHPKGFLDDPRRVSTNHDISALSQGNGPLCVLANRNARDAESGRLFLQSAAVGDHQRGARPKT